MPSFTDITSWWLERAVSMAERRRKEVANIRLVVHIKKGKLEQFVQAVKRAGMKYIGSVDDIAVVKVSGPPDIDKLARLPGVEYVAYERKFWPMAVGLDELAKRITVATDPLLSKLTFGSLVRLGIRFKPPKELPTPFDAMVKNLNALLKVVNNPLELSNYVYVDFPFAPPVFARAPFKLVTDTREIMEAPEDNAIKSTLVGVIDTGARYGPGIGGPYDVDIVPILTKPEPPTDTMGHGTWVQSCAFGRPATTRYGKFVPVAQAPKVIHVKTLGADGTTTEFQVLKAMEFLANKGVKVVNLSLGGPATESVERDATAKLITKLTYEQNMIFVVAAGNEGPDDWTIASPGITPAAITVAAVDWATMGVSSYSSRGPQGHFYKGNSTMWEEHLEVYGEDLIKPDLAGIGGDSESQVVAGCSLWYDGLYDFVPDGFDEMIGTSMATPHVAGLVALLYDRGVIKSPDDIKSVLAKLSEKDKEVGYGLFKYNTFITSLEGGDEDGGEPNPGRGGRVY